MTDAEVLPGFQERGVPDWLDLGAEPRDDGAVPTAGETFSAAFGQFNKAFNAGRFVRQQWEDLNYGAAASDFDALDHIQGTDLEPYAERFFDVKTPKQLAIVANNVRRELKDRDTLARSSGANLAVAALASGVFDFDSLVGGGAASFVKAGGGIYRVMKGAAIASATAAGTEILGETALHQMQETRTLKESAINVGGSALLAGLLGAGVSALTAAEFRSTSKALEKELAVPELASEDILGEKGWKQASTAGAAQVNEDTRIAGAFGLEKALKWQDPLFRTTSSPFKSARVAAARLAETPMSMTGDIIAPGGAVETLVKSKSTSRLLQFTEALDDAYSRYRFGHSKARLARLRGNMNTAGGKYLTYGEFKERAALAGRRGDNDIIPEVAEAARAARKFIFDPGKNDAIAAGLLADDVTPQTAVSYITRLWSKPILVARRADFMAMTNEWLKLRQAGLQNEMKGLKDSIESGAAERLGEAAANQKRIAALEAELRMSDQELNEVAEDIYDALISGGDGRIAYRLPASVRGPLKDRTFLIPDDFRSSAGVAVEGFLENDMEQIARAYNRSIIPDVEIKNAFGDLDMTDAVKKIRDEAKAAQDALPKGAKFDKERAGIDKSGKRDINDLLGMRDRIRGTYAIHDPRFDKLVRTARVVRSLNYMRLLGGMTVSAIPDLGKLVFMGSDVVTKGLVPMVTNFKAYRLASREVKLAGTAADMTLDTRTMALADIMDDFGRASKFERAIQAAQGKFGLISLMAPWNAAIKQFTGVVTLSRMLEDMTAWAKTGKLDPKKIQALADARIDEALAARIAAQFEKHGETDGGAWLPKTEAWDDQVAAQGLRSALVREVDRIIVTPGQDKPLWFSTELGKVISQFRTFGVSSMQRTLVAGVQQNDAAAYMGLAMMLGLGALTAYFKSTLAGKALPETAGQWVAAAFDNSGIAGWLFDANNIAEKATGGKVGLAAVTGKELSRYQNRSALNSAFGPSVGFGEDVLRTTSAAFNGFSDSDIRAARRLWPTQNIFYLRGLVDRVEAGAREVLPEPAN